MSMRTLLGVVLVLVMGAAGCQPTQLEQCREAVKVTKDLKGCTAGYPDWDSFPCDNAVLNCMKGS